MLKLLAVGLGGFVGALARYGVTHLVHVRASLAFPWGTLACNLLGCAAIGVVAGLVERGSLPDPWRQVVAVGLIGSFTTFSTFGLETLALLDAGRGRQALALVAASVLVGVAAVAAGRALVRSLA